MKKLMLKCKPLDLLLNGGIESSSITEIFGEAGTGKTNFCLQASREYANTGRKVAFIDSEGVSLERLRQICDEYDYKRILKNILFFCPKSFEDQEKMINKSIKISNVGMIIVDTINMLYRMKLENDEEAADRSLTRQITDLQLVARKKDLYVLIAAQVYTAKDGDVRPFAGRGIEHIIKTMIKFEKTETDERQATIVKHSNQQREKSAFFNITGKGLE